MKKLAVAIVAAIVIVSIVALHLWSELRSEREQYAGLQARVAEIEAAQKAASVATAQAAPAPAPGIGGPQATPGQTGTPVAPTETGRNPVERARTGLTAGVAEMMASPEGKEMMRSQVRAELARQFPDLANELNLSPAEADKFLDLLARQASDSTGDALGLLGGGGDSAAMQEMQRKLMARQQASDAELAAMLGSRYPKWQEYQGTVAARQQVTQLRAMLGSGENALSEAQTKPLVAALGAETARLNKESRDKMASTANSSQNMLEEQLRDTTEHNQRLVKVAASHLNDAQLDGYKRMLAQQESMARMLLGTMNGQKNAPGQGGATR